MINSLASPVSPAHNANGSGTHKVVIVNGSPDMAGQFESVLSGGHYDVVFVESSARAYSQIKRVQPELVVLCVQTDGDGLQVLSMLKLDKETRGIPVVTCTTDDEEPPQGEEDDDSVEAQLFPVRRPHLLMN
jgi:CheY-like chemotaxis protein